MVVSFHTTARNITELTQRMQELLIWQKLLYTTVFSGWSVCFWMCVCVYTHTHTHTDIPI